MGQDAWRARSWDMGWSGSPTHPPVRFVPTTLINAWWGAKLVSHKPGMQKAAVLEMGRHNIASAPPSPPFDGPVARGRFFSSSVLAGYAVIAEQTPTLSIRPSSLPVSLVVGLLISNAGLLVVDYPRFALKFFHLRRPIVLLRRHVRCREGWKGPVAPVYILSSATWMPGMP